MSFIWPKAKNGKRYGRLTAKIAQKDPTILYWIRDSVGYGGVFIRPEGRCADYCVTAAQVRKFLELIRPYLRIKGEKVDEKIELDLVHVKS